MGISGKAHSWFESYLTGRSFNVSLQGQLSVPHRLTTGVTQGSVMGPLICTPPRWAPSSARMVFHITAMQMIPNCLLTYTTVSARLVFNQPKRAHVTPLLIDLHWLPVAARITFKSPMLAYRVLDGSAPTYLNALVS